MSPDPSRADAQRPADAPARLIGILTTDTQLVITSWDAPLASMTGIASANAAGRRLADVVPDMEARGLLAIVTSALETGSAQVLAPALHGYFIPCPAITPSTRFDLMQQRAVVGALREDDRTVGLIVTVEDVTERLEREHQVAAELRDANPDARLRAIERLASVDPVDGIGPLHEAMGDEDWQVRRLAVQTLASRFGPR